MILVDFSSIIHRMIHSGIAGAKPKKVDGKYVTSDFIGLTKYYILQDLFSITQEHGPKFGDIVICLDKSTGGYWRKDVYSGYKSSRKKGRDASEIDYGQVFSEVDELIDQIRTNLPWKVVEVPRAEADDIMLVLAKEFHKREAVLIHSPDKDMIQAQRDNDSVFQYSSLTKKWVLPENKHDHMDHWITEHVCLGDASDDVPRVVDHTEFSDAFFAYLSNNGFDIRTPMEFRESSASLDVKKKLLQQFDVYKLNRAGESTGVKDVYRDIKFGPSTLQKKIKEHGSLDNWLDSHPLYRKHYERNYKLVMEEGIPDHIRTEIVIRYEQAETVYNRSSFEEYLHRNNLKTIIMDLPSIFKVKTEICAADFGW